jgi:hypothetical protein
MPQGWEQSAFEYYVNAQYARPGCEFLRSLMFVLRPAGVGKLCVDLATSNDAGTSRECALDLLRGIADRTYLPVLLALLNDPQVNVQNAAVNIIDQIDFGGGGFQADDYPMIAAACASHQNHYVKENLQRVLENAKS